MPSSSKSPAVLARNGVLLVFTVNGFVFASWMARLPDVKSILNLTPGQLGVMLLATSAGALLGLPVAGRINDRVGPAVAVRGGLLVGIGGTILAAAAVTFGTSMYQVMPGMFLLGLGTGVWDVAQNLEGSRVEQAIDKAIMPWFHAGFSAGTVLGALTGAAIVWLQIPVLTHILVVGIIGTALAWWGVSFFLAENGRSQPAPEEIVAETASAGGEAPLSAWLEPRTLLIGVMVLAAAFTEGTANDWMAVAFVDGHHVTKALGVLALAVFLTAMTLGRILGTMLLDKYGRVPVLRILFGAAIIGSLLVVFGSTGVAYVGAAIWGIGASLGFPVGMSAASDDPERAPFRISVVATIGYTAFLAGPPVLGLLGDHVGVLRALLLVSAVSLLAMLVVPAARPLESEESSGNQAKP